MATAPTPGSTRPPTEDADRFVTFVFADGTVDVTVDMRTITMRDRRLIRIRLRELWGTDVDWQDGLVGALWIVMRRDDPTVELDALFDRVSIVTFTADDTAAGGDDDPEA